MKFINGAVYIIYMYEYKNFKAYVLIFWVWFLIN